VVASFVELGEAFDCYVSAAYFQRGEALHVHRKVYLPTYGMFDEERYLSRGNRVQTFPASAGRVGMLVCEDLWHPSTVYIAAMDGMDLLIAPASSPGRGVSGDELDTETTYRALLSAYAQLFQCYVVFVNRVGYEDGVCFWGGSRVIDPFGRTVASAPRFEPALVMANIDLDAVRRSRIAAPLLQDERLDMTLRELLRVQSERGSWGGAKGPSRRANAG
jgi:predicted amidohydrolase